MHPEPAGQQQMDALDAVRYSPRLPWYETGPSLLPLPVYRCIKRAIDILVAICVLPLALPILAICILAVKLDSAGPAWFFQQRTGKDGRRFRMMKLRTMEENAEELKTKYMHLNEAQYPDFKITDDPRVTRVGGWLRRTSLDELPQLFNVLNGDMTLVGPRPTSFPADKYVLWHTARLEAKPGLSGLWQVSGRCELQFDERVRLDMAYIRNQCLLLDLKILRRTVSAVVTGRGAA
jgi:lipopolysaccharide/colanic/teichoic acid biosynthesis glycosyltransferase